jgi:hypothetical protein
MLFVIVTKSIGPEGPSYGKRKRAVPSKRLLRRNPTTVRAEVSKHERRDEHHAAHPSIPQGERREFIRIYFSFAQ